jgi:hypothetical protein
VPGPTPLITYTVRLVVQYTPLQFCTVLVRSRQNHPKISFIVSNAIIYILKVVGNEKVGCPLSGVVYFGTILFFTLLTWVTIAVILIYYHEDIWRYQFTFCHTFHIYDKILQYINNKTFRFFPFGRLYIKVKTVHKRYSLAQLSKTS